MKQTRSKPTAIAQIKTRDPCIERVLRPVCSSTFATERSERTRQRRNRKLTPQNSEDRAPHDELEGADAKRRRGHDRDRGPHALHDGLHPVSIVRVVMVISRDVRVYRRTIVGILTFLSGNHAWQHDPEEAPVAFVALDLDAPAVGFDGPSGDGQAEAGAAGLLRAGIVHAIKALEDSLAMRRGNARSRVVH